MDEVGGYRRKMPHVRSEGAVYAVAWRLHPDQALLTDAERALVGAALRHFDGARYLLGAWCVMDDHVHALVQPEPEVELTSILHTWKSYTAHALQREYGRHGAVWQHESFDRVVRGEWEYERQTQYVLGNPFRRWPDCSDYPHAGIGLLEQ